MTTLNNRQQEAVMHKDGPLLILAGAGSGKTSVLTKRAAYLIGEYGISPYNIMAITFTNKAAGEMKERIAREVGLGSEGIWCATFHSSCVRILRRHIDRLGYDSNFTIYDTDDQKKLMKEIIKRENLDPKMWKERAVIGRISAAKDKLIDPVEYLLNHKGDFHEEQIAKLYRLYQSELKKNNALDFDDLIVKTVELFQDHQDVLRDYQERFQYIMVDEYQDTNRAQFVLIRLLAERHHNLCVVGDDDQSIYKFRGADIRNILDFEKNYPEAKVIRLEQNYRSTQTILDAANSVIRNNRGRKGKELWTANGTGEKINFVQYESAYEEAESISRMIMRYHADGGSYSDNAILYRTNAQSRMLEEKLLLRNIPYKLVGGVNFYSRKEVKDLLAYLKVIDNGRDDLAVDRILNVPKRGIGATTVGRVQEYAMYGGLSFFEALEASADIPGIGRSQGKIKEFVDLIHVLQEMTERAMPSDILSEVIERTGYIEELRAENTDESKARIENIDELFNKIVDYEESAEEATLAGFLQEVSLVADIDSLEDDKDYVVLMTLHAAKGLEFDNVFLTGMEDGLFPSYNSLSTGDNDDLEEERRLAYVGITRAKKNLFLSAARSRMVHGETQYNAVSRFVTEIPSEIVRGYLPKSRYEKEVNTKMSDENRPIQGVGYGRPTVNQNYTKKPYENPYSKDFGTKDASELGYAVGDRVKHIKFGEGTVDQIISGGRDFEVTVTFDSVGTKKLFAALAKLKKI